MKGLGLQSLGLKLSSACSSCLWLVPGIHGLSGSYSRILQGFRFFPFGCNVSDKHRVGLYCRLAEFRSCLHSERTGSGNTQAPSSFWKATTNIGLLGL